MSLDVIEEHKFKVGDWCIQTNYATFDETPICKILSFEGKSVVYENLSGEIGCGEESELISWMPKEGEYVKVRDNLNNHNKDAILVDEMLKYQGKILKVVSNMGGTISLEGNSYDWSSEMLEPCDKIVTGVTTSIEQKPLSDHIMFDTIGDILFASYVTVAIKAYREELDDKCLRTTSQTEQEKSIAKKHFGDLV